MPLKIQTTLMKIFQVNNFFSFNKHMRKMSFLYVFSDITDYFLLKYWWHVLYLLLLFPFILFLKNWKTFPTTTSPLYWLIQVSSSHSSSFYQFNSPKISKTLTINYITVNKSSLSWLSETVHGCISVPYFVSDFNRKKCHSEAYK